MMKAFMCLFIFSIYINAASLEKELLNEFKKVSETSSVEKKLLVALAKTESSYNKYSIGISANDPSKLKKFFIANNINFVQGKGDNHRLFSLTVNDMSTAKIYFHKFKYFLRKYPNAVKTYDLGIMQINISNIKHEDDEYKYLFNTKENIKYGAIILEQCYRSFKNVKYAVECYNKGTNEKKFGSFEYFAKVRKNYLELKI